MSTVRDIITRSLRLIGVIEQSQAPTQDDINAGVYALKQMLDSWSTNRLMIYTINPYTFTTNPPQASYTLGPGGDWSIERPMNIESAYVRYVDNASQPVDLPISILNDQQFASIAVKNVQSIFPRAMYDNGNYPVRTLTFYPVPTTVQTIVLWLWQPLDTYTNLNDEVQFPKGYTRAIEYGLALELAPEFGVEPSALVVETARTAINNIKRMNSPDVVSVCDPAITGKSGIYNYITDNYNLPS
jgi:hypothetical protein